MKWSVKKIINFETGGLWQEGYAQFGFHDPEGNVYFANYHEHWVAKWNGEEIEWSLGPKEPEQSRKHYPADMMNPSYVTRLPAGEALIVSGGTRKVFRFDPVKEALDLFIDAEKLGLQDIGNCEYDGDGNLWINEITGSRVWKLDPAGRLLKVFGEGEDRFGWIYDLRRGPNGHIYVLDSTGFSVKKIDIHTGQIDRIAGNGESGYSGDGEMRSARHSGAVPKLILTGCGRFPSMSREIYL
ncbi:hypothetical protein V3851_18865 [Paenibacillus sp. M1]|uniref:SMP-30/Gluconolactonase/LRE-like region domain-containing protein n=1 Tax=Paenibacillus haidiansis TaxID=1574488 RepID=A0ABU7VVV4_9BACL